MVDNTRLIPFIDFAHINHKITLVGCGAVGATIAELLVRMGLQKITLWDPDVVESHNISNQLYTFNDIGASKVSALADTLRRINPELEIKKNEKPFTTTDTFALSPPTILILAVDKMSVRKEITEIIQYSPTVLCIDTRMGFTEGCVYSATSDKFNWLADTVSYTDDDPDLQNRPVNACKQPLSVILAPRMLGNIAVLNIIKFLKGDFVSNMCPMDAYKPFVHTIEVK